MDPYGLPVIAWQLCFSLTSTDSLPSLPGSFCGAYEVRLMLTCKNQIPPLILPLTVRMKQWLN